MTTRAYRQNYTEIEWLPLPKPEPQPTVRPARADFPAPRLMRDQLDKPLQSMANGKWYDTKSGLRATYKPDGNPDRKEYVEIGNDAQRHKPFVKPEPDAKAIKNAVERAKARFNRGERAR